MIREALAGVTKFTVHIILYISIPIVPDICEIEILTEKQTEIADDGPLRVIVKGVFVTNANEIISEFS